MIARITTETGYYDSVVFALYKRGWTSAVIVFDQTYDSLKLVKMWEPERKVFIYDTEKSSDWVVKKKVEGYNWVLKNVSKRFFRTVINTSDILDKCKEVQATVENCDWFEIKNQEDILGLMECAVDFHDAYVQKMYTESEKQFIHFAAWGCEILFELDGNIQTNLFEDFGACIDENGGYLGILDSAMFIEDGLIYWTDDWTIKSSLNLDKSKLYYFCANRVRWKIIFPWL